MLKRTFPLFASLTAAALFFACLAQSAAYVLPYPANQLVFPVETLLLLCLSAALLATSRRSGYRWTAAGSGFSGAGCRCWAE